MSESNVFYMNGTGFDFVDGYGIINREDMTRPIDDLMKELKFWEEEKGVFDELPSSWTSFVNGTVMTDQGYKWYPSGVVTTPNNEVFPTRATNIYQFVGALTEDDGFVNT